MRTGKTLPLRINHSAEHPGCPLTYLPLHLWKDPKSSFASFWVGRWVGLLLGKWSLSSPPRFFPWTELFRVPECGSSPCWGSLLAHGPRAVATGDCIHPIKAPLRLCTTQWSASGRSLPSIYLPPPQTYLLVTGYAFLPTKSLQADD